MPSLLNRGVVGRRHNSTLGRRASVCAYACALMVLLASGWYRESLQPFVERLPALSRSGATRAEPTDSGAQLFRLGSACKPFCWSTVIGDFNRDGRPDVAVADHIGQSASQYAYRIGVSLSGQPGDDVTFESTHDALTISASDVDQDRDLDIVVAVPISGETIGVWLNDGHGHFTSANGRRSLVARQARHTMGKASSLESPAPLNSSRRRGVDGLSGALAAAGDISPYCLTLLRGHAPRSPLGSTGLPPRGPPNSSDVLSS
jgi:hypothetical protein